MSQTPLKVRAVAVAVADGQVLLVEAKRSPGAWVLPGGKIDPRETAQEAARREVAEETGVAVEIADLIAYAEVRCEAEDLLELYFRAAPVDTPAPDLPPGPEGRTGRWVEEASLPGIVYYPAQLPDLCALSRSGDGRATYLGCRDLR